jgi:adenylate kinase family enzyme
MKYLTFKELEEHIMHHKPKRIAIFGRPGAGKTTFTVNLNRQLSYPLHHFDKFFFVANWEQKDKDQLRAEYVPILTSDNWIIEGNGLSMMFERAEYADLVVYVRGNFLGCVWGMLKRVYIYKTPADDRAPGCEERVTLGLF